MAISSSCGALDNIVVDTIDTAQKCVTFLKEQNIGVATFIGLDKVKLITLGTLNQERETDDFLLTDKQSCYVAAPSHSSSLPFLR